MSFFVIPNRLRAAAERSSRWPSLRILGFEVFEELAEFALFLLFLGACDEEFGFASFCGDWLSGIVVPL